MENDRGYSAGKPRKPAKQQYILETAFCLFTEKGIELVTIPEIPEPMMFSATFHIMSAAVTGYAVELAVVYENCGDKDMLYSRFTKKNVPAFPLSDQLT